MRPYAIGLEIFADLEEEEFRGLPRHSLYEGMVIRDVESGAVIRSVTLEIAYLKNQKEDLIFETIPLGSNFNDAEKVRFRLNRNSFKFARANRLYEAEFPGNGRLRLRLLD